MHKQKQPPYLCGVVSPNQLKVMNIKSVKGYLIDVEKRTIEDIEIADYTQISLMIGEDCEYFTCPISWANGDTIYADDEGLFHEIKGGIYIPDMNQIIVGNVVVLGSNFKTGASTDANFTKDEVHSLINFLSKEQAVMYAGKISSGGGLFINQ